MSDSVQPHRWQPTRLPRPWDSPGKNRRRSPPPETAEGCPSPPLPTLTAFRGEAGLFFFWPEESDKTRRHSDKKPDPSRSFAETHRPRQQTSAAAPPHINMLGIHRHVPNPLPSTQAGPHLEGRQAPQASSAFRTPTAGSLQSWDRRVRPRLV